MTMSFRLAGGVGGVLLRVEEDAGCAEQLLVRGGDPRAEQPPGRQDRLHSQALQREEEE